MKDSWSWIAVSPVILTAISILAICVVFAGCYTVTQGVTMLGYLNKAIPLEQVEDKEFVRLVTDIRKFAMEDLGLAESRNYTKYVELDRNYLAAVVSASSRTSFSRHEWNYPIVGRLPYKGFFNVDGALKEREKLEKRELDVWVRGVDAFSTLGWFKDPLYSYMRNYSPSRLANLIIHELVHATIFLKGYAGFNEELAEFIGNEGSRLYMETRFGMDSAEYRQMLSEKEDSRKYTAFLHNLIAELEELYSSGLGAEETLMRKGQIINASKERFANEYENRFSSDNYRGFSQLQINNAYLDLFRLYHDEDNFYIDLYNRSGRDLPAFIAAAKTINARSAAKETGAVKASGEDLRKQLENALLPN